MTIADFLDRRFLEIIFLIIALYSISVIVWAGMKGKEYELERLKLLMENPDSIEKINESNSIKNGYWISKTYGKGN